MRYTTSQTGPDIAPEAETDPESGGKGGTDLGGRRSTLAVIAVTMFVTQLDNGIVNVALPSIRDDLGVSFSGLEWAVTSYILVFACLLLTGGRLVDLYGTRYLKTLQIPRSPAAPAWSREPLVSLLGGEWPR